ncbi:hypothetical protein THTE_0308 [Thermogutta terrifontis]|uniref:Uncharacterized protein n=1 Tax=Thermogutta terrifontis TaxID=1331910 RepID=A0A286RAD3_9BACT|nr:hypothetical protein THTE_0308 [Thermogutta terrifontis]
MIGQADDPSLGTGPDKQVPPNDVPSERRGTLVVPGARE